MRLSLSFHALHNHARPARANTYTQPNTYPSICWCITAHSLFYTSKTLALDRCYEARWPTYQLLDSTQPVGAALCFLFKSWRLLLMAAKYIELTESKHANSSHHFCFGVAVHLRRITASLTGPAQSHDHFSSLSAASAAFDVPNVFNSRLCSNLLTRSFLLSGWWKLRVFLYPVSATVYVFFSIKVTK